MAIQYLSVCSGIEAATVAWHELGWEPVAFSEIEPFPCKVLAHHYPNTPNWGDMTKFKEWPDATIDALVGGTPCQSFSVAGLRQGLEDPRGELMLTYLAIAARYRPRWVIWENVPGVLSSNGGRDFGAFLGALGQLGYGWAYRVLDAQWFGVAQRRRRVFVVGCLGDSTSAAKVLFESESVRRDTPSRRKSGKEVAGYAVPGVAGSLDTECGGGKLTHQSAANGHIVPVAVPDVARTLNARHDPISSQNLSHSLGANANATAAVLMPVAVDVYNQTIDGDIAATLNAQSGAPSHSGPKVLQAMQVRRLTVTECERLQGFPDDYTNIPGAKDAPRYKALGNSMAVPCMRWIGERICN
jgi:DNA (cytosine-5)-methyltransferase 1